MNKIFPILIVCFTVVLGLYLSLYLLNDEDHEISNIQETSTSTDTVTIPDEQPSVIIVQDQHYCVSMIPESPMPGTFSHLSTELKTGDELTSGDLLRGCVLFLNGSYGKWSPFEGQVGSYAVYASDDTLLAQAPLPVSGPSNWLDYTNNSQHIPFEHIVNIDTGSYTHGYVVFRNENASGEPAGVREITIDVTF